MVTAPCLSVAPYSRRGGQGRNGRARASDARSAGHVAGGPARRRALRQLRVADRGGEAPGHRRGPRPPRRAPGHHRRLSPRRDRADERAGGEASAGLAGIALNNGSPVDALHHLQPLLADPGAKPEDLWQARALTARAHEALGDLERSVAVLEPLRRQAEKEPHRWPWLAVVTSLCRCYREAGDLGYSIQLAESALGRVDELGLAGSDEQAELAATLVGSFYERGDLARATVLADELIDSTRDAGARAQAAAYWNASLIAQERGRVGEAVLLAEKALARLGEGDGGRNLVRLRLVHAGLMLRQDEPDTAAAVAVLQGLLEPLSDTGSQIDVANAETELARAWLMEGDAAAAEGAARSAIARLGDRPRMETAWALILLGRALKQQGGSREASVRLRHAAQILDSTQAGRQAAAAWGELADVLMSAGETAEAVTAYRRALAAAGVQAQTAETRLVPPHDAG